MHRASATRGGPPLAALISLQALLLLRRRWPRVSLYVILRVYVRTRLSLFCDIRFPNSPHSVRGATERKHLDILEYEHCVNIRSVLSALSLSLSPLPLPLTPSLFLYLYFYLYLLCSCLSRPPSRFVCLFFLMRVLRVGQRYDRWNHSHSSRAYRAFR